MPLPVLTSLRATLIRGAAIVAIAGLATGCSSGVARFDDGFYTGAVPQGAGQTQMASAGAYGSSAQGYPNSAGYGSGIDGTRTGSVSNGGSYGSVQAQQLPPPPSGYGSGAAGASTGYDGQPNRYASERAANQPGGMASASTSNTNASGGATLTVQSGDTLTGIARRTGTSVSAIKAANGLDAGTIRIGQTLTIPGASQAQVAALRSSPSTGSDTATQDTATRVASTDPSASVAPASASTDAGAASNTQSASSQTSARPAAANADTGGQSVQTASLGNDSQVAAPDSSGISKLRWPVTGRVLKGFGEKVGSRRNDGVNISVPRGTPVKAAENGVVIYSGDGLKDFGNTVLVKHDNGLVTVYGHADSLDVKRGDKVRRGQVIAKSGMSGDASAPVLHFEVRKDSTPVDPTGYLG